MKQWDRVQQYLDAPAGHGPAILQLIGAQTQTRAPTAPARRPGGR